MICNILGVVQPAVIVLFNLAVDFFLSYLVIKYIFARVRPLRLIMGLDEIGASKPKHDPKR